MLPQRRNGAGQNGKGYSFDQIKCEYLTDSYSCEIASKAAGFDIIANPATCKACLQTANSQTADNLALGCLIAVRREERGEKLPSKVIDASQLKGYIVPKSSRKPPLGEGPGTELSKLLPARLESKACHCKDYARKMNRWGVEGCELRFEKIVKYLVSQGQSNPLLGWIPSVATQPVARRLLRLAIDRANKNQTSSKFKWFTAVVTAPRPNCTLHKCIDSMIIAGFDPVIFAEPESTQIESCETIQNSGKKGIWHNWLSSCEYALNESDANVIMTVQDDSLFHPDSKVFAESVLWPDEHCGFVSLYTPNHYTLMSPSKTEDKPVGVNRIHTRSLWGACALIWPRAILEQVIDHEIAKTWLGARPRSGKKSVKQKRQDNPHMIANSDTAIGKIMNKLKRTMYFVDPSPVEHIASYSTIGHGDNRGRRNCKRCADWSTPLAEQVPVNFEPVDIVV